ncbi:HpcH/HpaI aldolase/citrate lyase family protein [Tepidibacter formicigenes]|jgi:citrate lyase beta subunit|uniref:Citrate lyase beta subunit n=1 Tax=Tepidibacter formicigenes DSM 15518 TaxID=1123349 RepID=A0A1M6R9U5_9FIRM|nr:HpcH/HpaI aldolase/citrate lyase family protein [Tepidibacter formicigenes]SHK29098.1 Citrate lyase beta subunit [Tepidibacter formicigenes DSM 15518]
MQYFNYLTSEDKKSIFYSLPMSFERDSDKEILSYALGSTLYMPATREKISQDIISFKYEGLMSMVICLEDAIGDKEINKGTESLVNNLKNIFLAIENGQISYEQIPLIFIRVRSPKQINILGKRMGSMIELITGFVFPKFSINNGRDYFEELKKINFTFNKKLYGMPILETADIIYRETRIRSLNDINKILNENEEFVLNVRIGATDFSSLFGIRRSYDVTIYDIAVIRDCIADIVNIFSRVDREYVISGPVWEYFCKEYRVLKPQLRQSPFEDTYGLEGIQIRANIIDKYIDGLIREVSLDKVNGLIGKTIIHPSHILPVQALHVVSHEDYVDACSILDNDNGQLGVMKSQYLNKMNEIKPHINWANKIVRKGKIYGVFNEKKNFTSLLEKKIYI